MRRSTLPAWTVAALLATALAVVPHEARAQQAYDSTFFRTLSWRNIGPVRGGRSTAATGSPTRPNEYYFGAVGGGLWKTTDGGQEWQPVTDGQLQSSSVGAVAVAESNPDVVYIGMGETEFRGNIMQGDGIYKSTDAGKTWTHMGLEQTQAIARIRVSPTNPDLVYVAALGHPFGKNPERGVFRSRDGGTTWQKVLYVGDDAGAVDLVMDRTNPDVLYASTWQVYRTPWKMWGGGPHSGLWKTTDGGDHWTELTGRPGMPAPPIGKIGVAVSAADPAVVYATVEANEGGVFRSADGGATWTKVNEERSIRQRAFYYTRIYTDPKNANTVYALNTSLFRSTDGGKTFRTIRTPHGDHHDLWIDPTNPRRMINSNDGGANVSVDGGRSWTDQDFPTAQLYHVIVTSDFPYHVCGAQQDNSTICVPSDGWRNMQARGPWMYSVAGGESGYIAEDPDNPDIFYAGSQGALLTRYNRATGQVRDVQVYPRFFSGEPSSALPERWQWTFPIVFSPVDHALYTSSQHVFRSTNQGQTWERISPDLTLAVDSTLGPSGGLITMDMNGPEIYGTVFTIAPSYQDAGTIWTGSDDGLVYLTRDGGKAWTNITPSDLPKLTRISLIEAGRHDAATAYVAAKRYQSDDRAPYIWRTHDFGKTWTKIVNGIPGDDFVHAVREDPVRAGLLYAGTEHGAWISFDDGDHWQSLQLDLPNTQVADLVVTANDLVAGTHGRSMYVLDDIAPLRQLAPAVRGEAMHLFQPHDVVRGAQRAAVQFLLRDAPAPHDTVRVEMLDSAQHVIRSFQLSADTARSDSGERGGGGFRQPAYRTQLGQGLNRFEWDLRVDGAASFPGMILWSGNTNGPEVVPGRYGVRLTGAGASATAWFAVTIDPKWTGVTTADLKAQFDLLIKIRDRVSAANRAVITVRDIRRQVDDRAKATPRIRTTAKTLLDSLTAVEEDLYQVRNRSGQDPLNFPIKLNNRLASLGRSVSEGDAKPTDAAYRVFDELSAELDRHLARLHRALTVDLPRVNRTLGQHPLVVPPDTP